jgi:MacB-like periplasmic core domain/FtsX-like permease family
MATVKAAWMRAQSELRRRWAASAMITVVVAVAVAVALAAWAGARRTDSAYPDYLASTHAADYLVATGRGGTNPSNAFYRAVDRLPQVELAGVAAGPSLVSESGGRPDVDLAAFVQSVASADGRVGYGINSMRVLAGHLPATDQPYAAFANRTLALRRHLHVGSRITMYWSPPTGADIGSDAPPGELKPVTFTITGIGVSSDEVVPVAPNDGGPTLFLTPAYHRLADIGTAIDFDGTYVRLLPGASRPAFLADVHRLAGTFTGPNDIGGFYLADLGAHASRVERAIHPEALALELFAGLVALAAVLSIGQVISREVSLSASDDQTLRAIGFDRSQLILAQMVRMAGPVLLGALLGTLGALAASPLMPIGAARLAEPRPGVSVDGFVLTVGFASAVALLLGVTALAARRATRPAIAASAQFRRPSRTVEALARAGLRPPAVTGLRMAIEPGRGRTAVPVHSAAVGLVMAVAAVVAVLIFSSNLGRLVSTPAMYGDTWGFAIDSQFNAVSRAQIAQIATGIPGIESLAGGTYGDDVTIDGRSVPTIGIDSIRGTVFPTLVKGRSPENPEQIDLGAATLRQLHKRIGDTVTLNAGGGDQRLTIVGEVVLPSLGRGSFTPTDLGQGAATLAAVVAKPPAGPGSYNFVLIRFSTETDVAAATRKIAAVAHAAGCPGDQCLLTSARVLPTDVRSYSRVRSTPAVLAAILGLLGLAMIGHTLVTSVRRHRRDLAVLKTLGFVKRDVAAAVAWQVSAFACVGVALGIPLGIVLGRWLWTLFAQQIGIPSAPMVPALIWVVVPGVLVTANLIGALPARTAARTMPAAILGSE